MKPTRLVRGVVVVGAEAVVAVVGVAATAAVAAAPHYRCSQPITITVDTSAQVAVPSGISRRAPPSGVLGPTCNGSVPHLDLSALERLSELLYR